MPKKPLPITKEKAAFTLAGLLAVGLLGVCDAVSGPDLSFLIFYLAPVLMVSWAAGFWGAVLVSVASTLTWFLANETRQLHSTTPILLFWNLSGRLGMFVILSYVLARLRFALEREHQLAATDFLTGCGNRRAFVEILGRELDRSRRHGRPVTVAYLDIDRFKVLNDRLGHHTGDAALQSVARTLEANLRGSDFVARLGGDEFAVLLPEASQEAAREVMSRLQVRLESLAERENWPISFSIGVVTCAQGSTTADEVMRMADRLMYAAKATGDHVIRYELFVAAELSPGARGAPTRGPV